MKFKHVLILSSLFVISLVACKWTEDMSIYFEGRWQVPDDQSAAKTELAFGDLQTQQAQGSAATDVPSGAVDDTNKANPGVSQCAQIEVFEEDIRENKALFPEVVVYANSEGINPPDGYQISYPPQPDSVGLNTYWRIILLDGGAIEITTSEPVACAGVIFISDYISPASIYINGELKWNDYLYPPAQNNPSKVFYVRIPVEPARPITIQVIGRAPGGDYQNAYVPIYAFGFDLP